MTGEKERVTAGLQEFGRRLAAPPGGVLATPRSGATLRPLLAAVETMQLGVVIADESGVILYANPAQARMYGVDSPEEITRQEVSIFGVPGYRDSLSAERLEEITSWRRESVNVRKDGSELVVRLLSDVLRGPDGEATGVITTCEDLTDIRTAETEQNRLKLQIRQSHSLENLGALTSGLAHEFKDLLSVLHEDTGPFMEAPPLDADAVRGRIAEADAAFHRMGVVIDQLLAFSQTGSQGMPRLDLNDDLRGMLRLFEASVDESVRFQYRLGEDLPLINADPSQVQHAVRQLIANASEAFEGRSGEIQLRTEARYMRREHLDKCQIGGDSAPGDYVALEVTDDGPGMGPEVVDQLFQPFYSTRSSSRGLGLTAIGAILERHGGAVWLSTQPGEGTCVRLLFPIAPHIERIEDAVLEEAALEDAAPEDAAPEDFVLADASLADAVLEDAVLDGMTLRAETSDGPLSMPGPAAPKLMRRSGWNPVVVGRHCPCCGEPTVRNRSTWYIKPLRLVLRERVSTRRCGYCYWRGIALHRD